MAAQFQLTMRSGPTPGKVFPLEAAEIMIGRDTSNGVAINDAEVSRRHAKLTLHGNAYALEDLGSTNGTFVNGTRLSGPFTLKAGDTVSFGENINLQYEAVFDPNATMASPAKTARATMAPPPAATPAAPAPVPSYSGQVPAGPAPVPAAPKKSGSARVVIIVIAIILVCLILACLAVFLWVDADKTGARWCMIPFRFIAQMLGGVCQ
jgi:predicted component of type VI protein secretion system